MMVKTRKNYRNKVKGKKAMVTGGKAIATGGKVIASGGYGCVFDPALKCQDAKKREPNNARI
jgi:hypothetical protein